MRGIVAILWFSMALPLAAGSRLRLDEGARLRQTRLSSSSLHTCAVVDDGTVRCWGDNTYGQVGDGTSGTPKLSPVQVSGLVNIVSVAAGYTHSCAIHAFGAVFCWGDNSFGALGNGDGTTAILPTPVEVTGLDSVTALAAGFRFTCALRANGTVWCWGFGGLGQLGNGTSGTSVHSLTPVQVKTTLPAVAVTAGRSHACAVLLDPSSGAIVQCWGANDQAQTGDGTTATSRPLPVTASGLSGVVDIAAGTGHTCALLVDGQLRCWGNNADGQAGTGFFSAHVLTPVRVVVDTALHPLGLAIAISGGGNHSCALFSYGSIRCWGDDTYGQLGDAQTNNMRTLANTDVLGLNDGFEIVAGAKHTCAVEVVNGTGRCWGDNSSGQLGNGTTNPASVPNTVNGVPGSTSIGARGIRASDRWNCARRGNGTLACWGGAGSSPAGPNPITIAGLSDAVSLGMNLSTTCAVESSGHINCFDNNVRQLYGILGAPVAISEGAAHTCTLDVPSAPAGGFLECFGSNSRGQLGSPGATFEGGHVVDAQGLAINDAVMVTSGAYHSCALTVDGKVYCWGDNTAGQLGQGNVGGLSSFALPVPGLSNIVAISAGLDPGSGGLGSGSFTCALSATGAVSCWGAGGKGQLGNGSNTAFQPVAQPVFGLTDAVTIAAGRSHACAVLAGGSAVCWGDNSLGQLGASDTLNHSTPVPVIASIELIKGLIFDFKLAFLTAISPGISHTCALQTSGQPLCWGDNSVGEIGNGTISSQPQLRPAIVNSFTANVQPAVSLKTSGRIAIVNALMNCPTGGEAHISLTLEQGSISGSGMAVTACEGGLVTVPITVPAQGPAGFQAGAATAIVEAVVKDQGVVAEDQHWTRAVVLSFQP